MPLGFSETAILDVFHGNTSAKARNTDFRLPKACKHLLLAKNLPIHSVNEKIDISGNGIKGTTFGNLSWALNPEYKKENLSQLHLAFISLDHVESIESLVIRNVSMGDKMQSFGLKGQKLMSDLFVNHKLNTIEKVEKLSGG